MIICYILAAFFVVIAVVFLLGKGDELIAGYNTMSEEKREEIDIKRLRLLMAITMFFTAAFCLYLPFIGDNSRLSLLSTGIFIAVTLIMVILANTWAKKK
ncbi:MAG: DUF3784 domain-containing protein [Bacteroidaceae bacterium]|nr:DUF3784 domain-containing protein [Bacteroidaceae bacterium]